MQFSCHSDTAVNQHITFEDNNNKTNKENWIIL